MSFILSRKPGAFPGVLSASICAALALHPAAANAQLRPFTVDDVLGIQSIGQIVASPSGNSAAVVIKRGLASGARFTIDYLDGNDRADVWLVSDTGVRAILATDGHKDHAGFWAPAWSPSGRSIALLSTRGHDNVRLFVQDTRTGAPRQLTTLGVDLSAQITAGRARRPGFAWLDERRLLVALLPKGATPTQFNIEVFASTSAPPMWREASLGTKPTASVIDNAKRPGRTDHRLVILDAITGKETLLSTRAVRAASVAPNGRVVALVVDDGPRRPRADMPLEQGPRNLSLHLLDMNGAAGRERLIRGVIPIASFDAVAQSWSPDGARLLTLGRVSYADREQSRFMVDVSRDSAEVLMPGHRVTSALWTDDGSLVALARPAGQTSARADWWLAGTTPRNLTATLPTVPSAFASARGRLYATINGRIHKLSSSGLIAVESGIAGRIRGIVLPRADNPSEHNRLLVQLDDSARTHVVVDGTGAAGPAPVAVPNAYSRAELVLGSAVLWSAITPGGTFLWTTSTTIDAKPRRQVALDTTLAGTADARRTMISYKSLRGDSLNALVLLPPGYVQGRRYPTVAWIYGGSVVRDTNAMMTRKNVGHVLNLQPLAARGYVVVLPSIPMVPEGTAGEPMADISAGVLPAIDRLVELGITDSARVGVAGHSYGGYSVAALLSQSDRFRAGVAMSAPINLASMYGTFDVRRRYAPNADEFFLLSGWAESGQGRLGVPPWQSPELYARNSPLFHAAKITTPLLLIHGDQDYVPIGQSEEMFTALNRLGRPVRFVRYWGEGHIFKSPANIRDMWGQVFAWFDAHL